MHAGHSGYELDVTIRDAEPADADAIAVIYNQGIEDRLATLETETPLGRGAAALARGRGPRHPVIVGQVDGRVVGWGSLNSFNLAARPTITSRTSRSTSGATGAGEAWPPAARDAHRARARELAYHKLRARGLPLQRGRSSRSTGGSASPRSACTASRGSWTAKWVDVVVMGATSMIRDGGPAGVAERIPRGFSRSRPPPRRPAGAARIGPCSTRFGEAGGRAGAASPRCSRASAGGSCSLL